MIKHESFNKILFKDFGEVFVRIESCRTFQEFCDEIQEIKKLASEYGYTDSNVEDDIESGEYKFLGDLFEIFAENFFTQFKSDNRIGVFNYTPVFSDDDNGVDGFAKNINGLDCTIQIKFRGNPNYQLKERDLKQFAFQSILKYNVDISQKNTMIVFTNCQGLHWYTDSNVFDNRIRVINGKTISSLIDNNEGFWNSFSDSIDETVKSLNIDKLYKKYKEIKNEN